MVLSPIGVITERRRFGSANWTFDVEVRAGSLRRTYHGISKAPEGPPSYELKKGVRVEVDMARSLIVGMAT